MSELTPQLDERSVLDSFRSESWRSLGYSNWTEYCRNELGKDHSWASRMAKRSAGDQPKSQCNTCVPVSVIDQEVRRRFSDFYWQSELRVGCGFGADGERRMDMWGISPKRPFNHIAVEIKRSRSDFRVDVKSPLKQRRARLFANWFYFAAPSGLLVPGDLPPWAGLIEISTCSSPLYGEYCSHLTHPAPWFDSSPPTWSFVAHLVRTLGSKRHE